MRDLSTLTSHPAAALGTVFHKLLELAVRNEIPREGTAKQDTERMLDRLLDVEDARLAAAWPDDPPRLRSVFPPLPWRRKRRLVLDLAEKYLSEAGSRATGGAGGFRDARDLPENGSWSEVSLEAPSLRLRGRVDFIQRRAGHVVLRDLKTGRVLANDGNVLPHIERQMRLYGAMAHVVWPASDISLFVDHGVEREVAFTQEHQADVLAWLRTVLDRLPSEREVAAEPLATPGVACDGCAHRHICPAYRRSAPDYWRSEATARMPLDVWGKVLSVLPRPGGLTDLTLLDSAGRTVKIFGLAARRGDQVEIGNIVWLFGLRTRDKRGGPGLWRHPRNYFEVADDDPFARAWSLQVFVERSGRAFDGRAS